MFTRDAVEGTSNERPVEDEVDLAAPSPGCSRLRHPSEGAVANPILCGRSAADRPRSSHRHEARATGCSYSRQVGSALGDALLVPLLESPANRQRLIHPRRVRL